MYENDNSAFLTLALIPSVIFDSDIALTSYPLCKLIPLLNILMIIGRNVTYKKDNFGFCRGRQHSFVEIDHEMFSTVILSLPLIQEGQLSVSGKRMHNTG